MANLNKKVFLMVKPSDFERWSTIDSEGFATYEHVPKFDLYDANLDFLLFEVKTNKENTEYDTIATELISGKPFNFSTTRERGILLFNLEAEELGLKFHKQLPLGRAITEPNVAAGKMTSINKFGPVKIEYLQAVREMFDTALDRRVTYDTAMAEGPSSSVIRSLRDSYSKL